MARAARTPKKAPDAPQEPPPAPDPAPGPSGRGAAPAGLPGPRAGATESQVTSQVLDAAKLFGIELRRQDCAMGFNGSGQRVRFGNPSDPDWTGTVPSGPNRGRRIDLELKREGFRPEKARGKERERFARQLARMKAINADGGLALWVDSGPAFTRFCLRLMDTPGLRVEFTPDGYPVMTDEPTEPTR